jgi:hypothetical protein
VFSLLRSGSETRKTQQAISQIYSEITEEVAKLQNLQKNTNPNSAIYKAIEAKIKLRQKALLKLDNSCTPTETIASTLEYGYSKNISLGVEALGNYRLFNKFLSTKKEHLWKSIEPFIKYQFFHNQKYILTAQTSLKLEKDQSPIASLLLLIGKVGKLRKYETFSQMGLTFGSYLNSKKAKEYIYSFSTSQGIKLPYAITLSVFLKYSAQNGNNLPYGKSNYEQFSVSKEFDNPFLKNNKFNALVGYYIHNSSRHKYIKNSGVVFSLWLEI